MFHAVLFLVGLFLSCSTGVSEVPSSPNDADTALGLIEHNRQGTVDASEAKRVPADHIDSIVGRWVHHQGAFDCHFDLSFRREGDSAYFHLETDGRVVEGYARVFTKKGIRTVTLPIEWDIELGDLTKDPNGTRPSQRTLGVTLAEEADNTLTFQNAGNAMNHYVIFKECDNKYVRLVKISEME